MLRNTRISKQSSREHLPTIPWKAGIAGNKHKPIEIKTMSYKKPEIVASSEATQSYVAGCPTKEVQGTFCYTANSKCMCGPLN